MDEQCNHLWPEDPEGRAEMGRGLLGLAFTNAFDSIFITWRNRIQNPHGPNDVPVTPGSISDRLERSWRDGLAAMPREQRDFVLRVIDDVLESAAYRFAITLDRFDHGDLSVQLTAVDDHHQPKFTVPIQPHGIFEMFQDVLAWKERFGRGADIGRSNPTGATENPRT